MSESVESPAGRQTVRPAQLIFWGLVIVWVFTTAGLGLLIYYRYPDNHGWGRDLVQWIYGSLAVLSIAAMKLSVKVGTGLLLLAALGLGMVYVINEWNILVGYDEWIERRMPDWGEKRPRETERPEGSYWTG